MNYTCPYCNQATTITGPNHHTNTNDIYTENSEYGFIGLRHHAISCPNQECKKLSLEVELIGFSRARGNLHRGPSVIENWKLLPNSQAKPQPDYIPEAITNDYYEACSILSLSPKASATLSRRCLQGIVRDYWDIPKGKRGKLGAELSYVREHIDPDTWEGIEAIRSVGDIGAHMEQNVNYVVDVEVNEAELLIELIEMLFEDWYVIREKRKQRAAKAKAVSQMKLAQKKEAKKKSIDTENAKAVEE